MTYLRNKIVSFLFFANFCIFEAAFCHDNKTQVQCGTQWPRIANGFVSRTAFGFLRIRCFHGSVLVGDSLVYCLESGDWSEHGRCDVLRQPVATTRTTTTFERPAIHRSLAGHDDNLPLWGGWSALHRSSIRGDVSSVRSILASPWTQVDLRGAGGYTAFILAAGYGRLEIAKMLVANGADIHARTNYGETALMRAAFNGHLDVVRFLNEEGATVTVKDHKGENALMEAAEKGHLETVRFLIEHAGANVNDRNNAGWTALMNATKNGHSAIVLLLIEKGADPSATNNDGQTAMEIGSRINYLAPDRTRTRETTTHWHKSRENKANQFEYGKLPICLVFTVFLAVIFP